MENVNHPAHHPLCSRSDRCAGDKCSDAEATRQGLAPRPGIPATRTHGSQAADPAQVQDRLMKGYEINIIEPESPQGKGLYGLVQTENGERTDEGVVRTGLTDALYWLACMEGYTLEGKLTKHE